MFLNPKNPKIDVRGTNLFNLIRSKKDFFWIKFIFGHDNPGFKCSKNMSCDEININNAFIHDPVCEFPKFGFLNKYWSLKTSHCTINISTEKERNLSHMNSLFKTKYTFNQNKQREMIYGMFKCQNPKKPDPMSFSMNHLSINNSSKEYINYIYEELEHKKAFLGLCICLQIINEWSSYPVVDLYFFLRTKTDTYDYNEIIKDQNFRAINHTVDYKDSPRPYNILVK